MADDGAQYTATHCARGFRELFQCGVLGLGLLQDGDVGVGVFPESQEILIGASRGVFVVHHWLNRLNTLLTG